MFTSSLPEAGSGEVAFLLDLRDVFELCGGEILTLMSNRIDRAVVPQLGVIFDEPGIA